MAKFWNINTKQVVEMTEDVDIFYQPYLGYIKNGNIVGHIHQPAYFDKEGNEYRKVYGKLISGTLTPSKISYN